MLLERIGGASVGAALKLHPAALLDDERGLVCRGVQVGVHAAVYGFARFGT